MGAGVHYSLESSLKYDGRVKHGAVHALISSGDGGTVYQPNRPTPRRLGCQNLDMHKYLLNAIIFVVMLNNFRTTCNGLVAFNF